MKALVAFYSRTRPTRKVAEAIAAILESNPMRIMPSNYGSLY